MSKLDIKMSFLSARGGFWARKSIKLNLSDAENGPSG